VSFLLQSLHWLLKRAGTLHGDSNWIWSKDRSDPINRSSCRNVRQRIRVVARNRVAQLSHLRIVFWRPVELIKIEQLRVEPEELVISFGALIAGFAGGKLKLFRPVAIREARFGRNVIYGCGRAAVPPQKQQ